MPIMDRYRLAIIVLQLSSGVWADSHDYNRRAVLKGIRGYEVAVEETKHAAFSGEDIRLMTEVALRRAGIKVIEKSKVPTQWVYVNVTALRNTAGIVAWTARIEIGSIVRLTHNKDFAAATIWSASSGVATVGADLYPDAVRGQLSKLLDQFVNDHLAANSK